MGCGCKRGGPNRGLTIKFKRDRRFSNAQMMGHEELEDHSLEKEKDSLVFFEKKFPLYKIHVNAWSRKLQSTGNTHVSIENLKMIFNSPAFQGKFEKGSPLNKVLASLPKCTEESFFVRSLELLGIAWCAGTQADKAMALFDALQPAATQANDFIAATDSDYPEVIETLIEIQSLIVLNQCNIFPESSYPQNDHGAHIKQMQNVFAYCMSDSDEKREYVRKAIRYMRTSEIEDPRELSGIIWQLYGYESKFTRDEFIDRVQTEDCCWILDGKATRIKLNHFLSKENILKLDEEAD